MGCPRRGQRVNTRDTQLNYIPAYRLCSCGYSRSLLRRSPLLYGMYACVETLTHCTSSTSTQSNASGGGAPCVTAGDTRAKRGGTRGQADYSDPDAGGVALKAWRGNSDVQKRGCCATPPASESGLFLLSTGSPFGRHPRLSMGCPHRGQWVIT